MKQLRSIISNKIGKVIIAFAIFVILLIVCQVRIGYIKWTGSMEPTLSGGDVTIYWPGDYAIGDIIIFERANGSRVIHRIVSINKHDCRTKGDNNINLDRYIILRSMILGKLRVVIPGIAKLFIWEGKR